MKVRNKKTGMIGEIGYIYFCGAIVVNNINNEDERYRYDSLADLNDEWEDVPEEVKKVWFIDADGELASCTQECEYDECGLNAGGMKSVGNYFETEEEARKAVEKLKALTEAKEDGLKIKGYYYNHEDLVILADIGKCNKHTLDTLFGKEID